MSDRPTWAHLDADESILWRGEPRARVVHWGLLGGLALAVGVVVLGALLRAASPLGASHWPVVAGLAILGVAGVALPVWVWRRYTEYVLTDEAIYHRSGVLWLTVTELPLSTVQHTSLSQGVFGAIFDHGSVAIDTASGPGVELQLRQLNDPGQARASIADRAGGDEDHRGVPGSIEEWRRVREEVRALRASLVPESEP